MNEYLEKMCDRLDEIERSKVRGVSTREVVAQSYDEAAWLVLIDQLKVGSTADWAAFRLHSFVYEQQSERVPPEIRRRAADAVAKCVQTLAKGTDESSVIIFIAWGTHRSDHKDVCLRLLHHPESWIRKIAVSYSGFFLRTDEFSKLIEFRHDPERAETGGMGGPLRFTLRDHALRVLKRLTNSPVQEDDCFEDTPHGRVFYKSWSPFLNWFEAHQK